MGPASDQGIFDFRYQRLTKDSARNGALCYGSAVPEAGIAQLVEHLICNQGVGGSSPSAGTKLYD